jgi:hypothetical protein
MSKPEATSYSPQDGCRSANLHVLHSQDPADATHRRLSAESLTVHYPRPP